MWFKDDFGNILCFDSMSKVCKAGDNKKRRQLNHIISEILLEGNGNLNFEPVVAHKSSELVESYRSSEKNTQHCTIML